MKILNNPKTILALAGAAALSLAGQSRAASMTNSPTAPAVDGRDLANDADQTSTDKWWLDAARGQTFQTGSAALRLKAITYRTTSGATPTKTYAIRVGTVSGTNFTQVAGETATQTVAWAAADYVTWTFAAPVLLLPNMLYGIDVGMKTSTSAWQTGIPYLSVTGDEFTGGKAFTSGASGVGTSSVSYVSGDRVFHLDLENPIGPGWNLVATSPADGATNAMASSPLSATFSQNIGLGTGNITLRNLTDAIDTVIPVGDARIAVSENLLTINPGGALLSSKAYAVRVDPSAITNASGITFEGIANDTTWNFTTSSGDPLLIALNELTSHIAGAITLSAAQIDADKKLIDLESYRFADSATNIAAAFNLVKTYETVRGPLWVVNSLPARSSVINDINWTVYTVMQDIMDVTYTAQTLVNYESLLNGFKFNSSSNFPGACTAPANPNQTYTAAISASYLNTVGRATQGDGPGTFARKPTGTYLAPGSIATVTVPQALVGHGYKIRVGAHSWDFSNKPTIKRLDRSSLVYSINALETKIASPLGGGIYIEVPYLATNGVVSVQIKNAVRSPFFSAKTFHTTTPAEWLTERANPAPWADFQSDKFMMQVPTSWISAMPDPTQLMADWDAAMDALNDLMGFPRIRGKEAIYTQVDLMIRASVFAPGYPSINVGGFSATANYGGYASHYLVRGPQYGVGANIEFHEQGHGYFFPKFGGESESTVNLPYVAVLHQKFGKSLDEAFRSSLGSTRTYQTLDTTAIAWMCVFNFSPNEQPMADAEKAYQLKGHAKFVDIARLFGWGGLNAFWASFVQDEENGVTSATDTDSKLLRLSQSVGKDIRPLFHFWGIFPQNPGALAAAIDAAGIPSSPEIRDRLLHYKTLVPANNAAFRTFAQAWWGRKPLITGYWEETDHAMQWDETEDFDPGGSTVRPNGDIYVEASAADIQGRVQELLDLYYPGGIAPNPMTFAIAPSAVNATAVGMTASTATASTGPVEYTFENISNSNSRAWSTSAVWTNTGLTTGQSYAYRVKARDGLGTETSWSAAASATPGTDVTPPSPTPMTFATAPVALGENSVTMTATTATDVNGVEYFFACTAGGGHDSGWQDSPVYTDTALPANVTFTYQVRARDKSSGLNATAFSAPASATTTDATPPALVSLSPADEVPGVAPDIAFVATFSEPIAPGTGNVTLKNLTDATQTLIAITDAAQISIIGAVLTINPTADLTEGKTYTIRIDATAIDDYVGNSFPGITNDTTWNIIVPDPTPPTPDPMTFAVAPAGLGTNAVVMTATTATDPSGPVKYWFENTNNYANSGWIAGTVWTNTGLAAGQTYGYKVKARDALQNETAWSAVAAAATAVATNGTPTGTNVVIRTALAEDFEHEWADNVLVTATNGWVSGPADRSTVTNLAQGYENAAGYNLFPLAYGHRADNRVLRLDTQGETLMKPFTELAFTNRPVYLDLMANLPVNAALPSDLSNYANLKAAVFLAADGAATNLIVYHGSKEPGGFGAPAFTAITNAFAPGSWRRVTLVFDATADSGGAEAFRVLLDGRAIVSPDAYGDAWKARVFGNPCTPDGGTWFLSAARHAGSAATNLASLAVVAFEGGGGLFDDLVVTLDRPDFSLGTVFMLALCESRGGWGNVERERSSGELEWWSGGVME